MRLKLISGALKMGIVMLGLGLGVQGFAKAKYGMAGCGLGSIVMGPDSMQTSAATTNGSFNSQGFGITSGTSNCLTPNEMATLETQQEFIVSNLSNLSKEMAQGDGETLRAFASTLGCSDASYSHFAKTVQNSYDQIFSAPGALAVLDAVYEEVKSDASLNKNCQRVL